MNYSYTITKSEVAKIHAARQTQCAEFEAAHFQKYGANPGTCPETTADLARIQWVNGKVEDIAFPIGKAAKWAKLLDGENIAVEFVEASSCPTPELV